MTEASDTDLREELRLTRLQLEGARFDLRERIAGDAAYNRTIARLEAEITRLRTPPAPSFPTPGSFAVGAARGPTQEPKP